MSLDKPTHLVINWIDIEDNTVLVGATDNMRWKDDRESGMTGVDAFSFVNVTIESLPKEAGISYAPNKNATFHCSHTDPLMKIATLGVYDLFKIAWDIKEEKLTLKQAKEKYFGFEIIS